MQHKNPCIERRSASPVVSMRGKRWFPEALTDYNSQPAIRKPLDVIKFV